MIRRTLPNGVVVETIDSAETFYLYREIFVERQYAPAGLVLPANPTIIDVGANIGMFSLFALAEWAPAQLIAVEPFSSTAMALRHNLGGSENVCVVQAAIADSVEAAEFRYYPHCTIMSGRRADPERDSLALIDGGMRRAGDAAVSRRDRLRAELHKTAASRFSEVAVEVVQQQTLDALIENTCRVGVDLLKIDVEGDELRALQGLKGSAAQVKNIIVEIDQTRVPSTEVMQWFTENRFNVRELPRGPGDLPTMLLVHATRRL